MIAKSNTSNILLFLYSSIQDYLVSNELPTTEEPSKDNPDGELDLTGIDDAEIDGYIMTDKEIEFKTKMWMRINATYLKVRIRGFI